MNRVRTRKIFQNTKLSCFFFVSFPSLFVSLQNFTNLDYMTNM